jgi:uncharacterized protein YoxC
VIVDQIDGEDWQASIEQLKKLAHDVEDLPPSVKHMIEQAWLASQQGQDEIARELLEQAKKKIES